MDEQNQAEEVLNFPSITHIMLEFPSKKSEILARASDGCVLAQRKNTVVIIGEDPNKGTSRVFIEAHAAHRFISEILPALDLAGVEMDYKVSVNQANELIRTYITTNRKRVMVEYREGPGEGLVQLAGTEVVPLIEGVRKIN